MELEIIVMRNINKNNNIINNKIERKEDLFEVSIIRIV